MTSSEAHMGTLTRQSALINIPCHRSVPKQRRRDLIPSPRSAAQLRNCKANPRPPQLPTEGIRQLRKFRLFCPLSTVLFAGSFTFVVYHPILELPQFEGTSVRGRVLRTSERVCHIPKTCEQPTLRLLGTGTKLVQGDSKRTMQTFWAPIFSHSYLLSDLKTNKQTNKNQLSTHASQNTS